MSVVHIRLRDIGENLQSAAAIACTINDREHKATFVRYAGSRRFVWVRIHGIREVTTGAFAFSQQLDMFAEAEPLEFVTEFIVNDAPGQPWHRTASLSGVER